jgi:diphthamide synthase subunit DPH2
MNMTPTLAGKDLADYILHLADSVVSVSMEIQGYVESTDDFDKDEFIASATAQFKDSLLEYIATFE